jgi:hypothetical protein
MRLHWHLCSDRLLSLAWGRLEEGGHFAELVVPRLWSADRREFPGRALWLVWGLKGGRGRE